MEAFCWFWFRVLFPLSSPKKWEEIVKAENENTIADINPETENILIAVNHKNTVEPLTNLALTIKSSKETAHLFALNIINEEKNDSSKKHAETLLNEVVTIGASADVEIAPIIRFDTDLTEGIANEIKVNAITDLVVGIDPEKGFSPTFVYNLYNGYLNTTSADIVVYQATQPISTIQKYLVIIPANAIHESRFFIHY